MVLCFDRFRFDRADQRLADSSGVIPLNPKAFEVLAVLIENPGQLVRKEQILDAVWPDTHVADGVLKVCIAEIRKALGDSVTAPRFIETVHRRGYRFVAQVTAAEGPPRTSEPAPAASLVVWPAGGVPTGQAPVGLVGRQAELDLLDRLFARALEGERQVVFVTGEAGAGKTALVEHFVTGVARRQAVAITGSQCLEQFGSTEAYMPVLEAISRLVREDDAARSLLRRYAPSWLVQLPWLVDDEDRDRLGRDVIGNARERMLREMAEFVEAFAARVPLVLVLDDLHWSDPSTVDLLALLAGRRESARLLVIGTYRPAELVLSRHPLRAVTQRLEGKPQCTEVSLDDLGVDAVAQYLERRFAHNRLPADVARLVRERTDGNPLFLVTLIDQLQARGALFQHEGQWRPAKELRGELATVPESLRRLIGQQLERLEPEDYELLASASLVGFEFSAAAAAAGAGCEIAHAEERLERLAGGPLLRSSGSATWPDGTLAECFAFRHPLYREVLAASARAGRRAAAHLRIGTVLERAYGDRSGELAAELALHFEEGGDRARALHYRRLAAQTAADRHALTEVETHLEKALVLLEGLPASPERDREEALLQSTVGAVRMATRGYAAPEADQAYARALELSRGEFEGRESFRLRWGMWTLHLFRAELDRALELAEQNRSMAEASGDRQLRLVAQHGLWTTHFFRGELDAARSRLDEAPPYEPAEDRQSALEFGLDLKVAALTHGAYLQWAAGQIDRAVDSCRQAVEYARALGFPMSLANALVFSAWIRCCRREHDACLEQSEAVIAYATEQGLPYWMPIGLELRGWALVERGEVERGIADLEQGMAAWTPGANLGHSRHLAHLAAAKMRAGRIDQARPLLEEAKALLGTTGERYHEPEIHRLDAELVLAEAGGADHAAPAARERAVALLQTAADCALRQGAPTLELRALSALVRLCGRNAKHKRFRARLADLLACFQEGLETADLREARQLVSLTTAPRSSR